MGTNLFQPLVAAVISAAIASRAYRKKSLDLSGAIAGFAVMTIHIAVNYRFAAALLVFFFTSSMFTKLGEDKKRKVDADFKEGGQRNWIQVLFNSGIATLLVLVAWNLMGSKDYCLDSNQSGLITALIGGIIGHYCCCNGDTWSSELGVLSDEQPRLITTLKPVQKGTNGGVTKAGLLAAAAGGSVIGLAFVITGFLTTSCPFNVSLKQLLIIPFSAVAGLCGSVIDSILGATLQYSGFCTVRNKVVGKAGPTVKKISGLSVLDNNAVNLVSILLTTLLTAFSCLTKLGKVKSIIGPELSWQTHCPQHPHGRQWQNPLAVAITDWAFKVSATPVTNRCRNGCFGQSLLLGMDRSSEGTR